jgi:hypothetical protein
VPPIYAKSRANILYSPPGDPEFMPLGTVRKISFKTTECSEDAYRYLTGDDDGFR